MIIDLENKVLANKIRKKILDNRFSSFIGFTITMVNENSVEGNLIVNKNHTQQNNFAHGGVMSTLCDTVAGFAAFTKVNTNQFVVTADLRVSYFWPALNSEVLFAKGWVEKAGNTLHFCESEVYAIRNNKKVVLAKANAVMAIKTEG